VLVVDEVVVPQAEQAHLVEVGLAAQGPSGEVVGL
jgi:hypothetical protein